MSRISKRPGKLHGSNPALLEASPLPTLLIFAVPIIMGNIFQQLYSIIDAIVIGKFLGNLSLAGISVANPITDIANAVIIGGSVGIGVLAANITGSGDMPRFKRTHSTALLAGVGVSALLSLLGCALSAWVLKSQGTEEAVCREALRYLYIVLVGLPFCFLYNYYSAMLRALGDSKTPFLILLASSLLHAALDYVLVVLLDLGIEAVACSTVFCQVFSSLCCIVTAYRAYPDLSLKRSELHFSFSLCLTILSFAWAAALQQAVVCIGRLLVQGTLTSLGTDTVTGYNMGMRAEAFIFCFSQGISAALAICISQNMGHGNESRMRRFYYCGIGSALVLAVIMGSLYRLNANGLIRLFSDEPSVISAGSLFIRTMSFMYIIAYLGEITQSFFRGLSRLRLTMFFSLLQIGIRVVFSYILVPRWGVVGICAAVFLGWVIQVSTEFIYSLRISSKLKD